MTSTSGSDCAIRCADVRKRFGDVAALDGLRLEVPTGSVTGYIGPNGAGKSTTIRILLDLARADEGTVEVLGVDPHHAGARLRGRIGYLPGELRLDDRLRVDETLRFWSKLRGGVDPDHVAGLCARLDLDTARPNRDLSSGNRRKVGLVGAFMSRPELLVLDEPTAGLDPLVQAEFAELVDEARADGATVFLSSHVLTEVQRIADHVVVLRQGKTVASGALADLGGRAMQPFTIDFDGPAPIDRLRGVDSVHDVVAIGDDRATGAIEGSPAAFLATVAQLPVRRLVMPEPDLEATFLHLYADERRHDHGSLERGA